MIAFSAMAVVITSASAAVLPSAKVSTLWQPEHLLGVMTSAEVSEDARTPCPFTVRFDGPTTKDGAVQLSSSPTSWTLEALPSTVEVVQLDFASAKPALGALDVMVASAAGTAHQSFKAGAAELRVPVSPSAGPFVVTLTASPPTEVVFGAAGLGPKPAGPLLPGATTRAIVAIVAVFGIVLATLSVNIAANVVSPAQDFANLAPRHISFQTGGLITGVLGILCMPWKLMADPATYLTGWLGGVGALLGPVAGIMIADYWLVRKQRLDVNELFRPHGAHAGHNPVAMIALALGVAPNLPGFLGKIGVLASVPPFFEALYPYAWFTGVAIAATVYTLGMRGRVAAPAASPSP
jgi:hypothetical protein